MPRDDLLTYLFDGRPNLLVQPMTTWLASSRRFAAFASTFQDKIRKKLRTTPDQEGLLDLQLELETAYLLLQERTLSVAYEPEQSKGMRSPDFTVTFTSSLSFMMEVTRVHGDMKTQTGDASAQAADLVDAIASKLGQLLPQRSNIVVIGVEAIPMAPDDIRAQMRSIQQRAERPDSTLLHMHGFRDRTDFFRDYQRLSEIIVRGSRLGATQTIANWINPQAKVALPSNVRTILYRSLTNSSPPAPSGRAC